MLRLWIALFVALAALPAAAAPQLTDAALSVATVTSGLDQPTTLGFIGANDFLVLERTTGRVRRVANGAVSGTIALDLDVSACSSADGDSMDDERGLLGIAIHPLFAENSFVYLFYTETTGTGDHCDDPFMPVFTTNRIERYTWNSTNGMLESPLLIKTLPSFVYYHNGGILEFGPDGKLYTVTGDNEQRGQTNNETGFGFDDTSVILRLNDDGSSPTDNPFDTDDNGADTEDAYYAYGVRNSFGLAFDPTSMTPRLWDTENGEDTYDEINYVPAGHNSGWCDRMGPSARMATPPLNCADPGNLVNLAAGDTYSDPEFSWLSPVGVTGIEFGGSGLGSGYENDLFVGDINNGDLLHFELNGARDALVLGSITDGVADTANERNAFRVGSGFNGITDLETGPDGALYVVSLFDGAVYRIAGEGGGPAAHDLAVSKVKAPKKISRSETNPAPVKAVKLTLVNQGSDTETIDDQTELESLVALTWTSLPGPNSLCPAPNTVLVPPKNGFPLVLETKKKLNLTYDVTWNCANDDAQSGKDEPHADFELAVTVDHSIFGEPDSDPSDDTCPRPASGDDKGCGGKDANGDIGGPIQTDVVVK